MDQPCDTAYKGAVPAAPRDAYTNEGGLASRSPALQGDPRGKSPANRQGHRPLSLGDMLLMILQRAMVVAKQTNVFCPTLAVVLQPT